MRALVLNGDKFAVEERPMPEPDVGEVLFRTHYSGVCGTDLHAPDLNFYTPGVIIGHEFAGEVAAVGPGVEEWQAGDRATVHPRGNFCGTCYECRHGWPNICSSDEFCAPAGSVRDGGMAAYVSLPAGKLRHLPDEVSMMEGAWAEPISIALRGVSRSGFGVGQRTVVIGAGPIGLLTTMLLRHGGASDITVIEPSEMRRAKAEEVGADLTINPFDDDPTATFGADIEMPDHVFECSGAYTAVDTAVDIVRPHGRVTLVGVASGAVSFHSLHALTKEVTIRSTSRNADEIVTATRLLARKALDVQALTSAIVPLEGALDALERLTQGNAIKILVQPTE